MSTTLRSVWSLITLLLFSKVSAVCNYIYIEEAPVPLESCYWNTPFDSWGLYCVHSYNGTLFTSPKVLELYFPAADCPGGLNATDSQFWALHDCTDDCYCSGSFSDCLVMTRRRYDYNTGSKPGCNYTYYVDEKFVWNECIDFGLLGSRHYTCTAEGTEAGDGLEDVLYTNTGCTGARKDTPAPSLTPAPTQPCVWTTCSGDIVLPTPFKWGTATAAYQIEGAVDVDGRLPSIWDTFSSIPNKAHQNETGAVADDNYHRYLQDINLMKQLNLSHYRLSFAWPRILPDGKTVNQKGIDHYKKVIDALLAANIEPFVTLYHWDLPQAVYDRTNGGWINESIVEYFELYASVVFDAFHDTVKYWLTFNEPWTFCVMGYNVGVHAPGRCTGCTPSSLDGNSSIEVYQCAHNVLLSHAAAVKYFRNHSYDASGGQIGITLNVDWAEPASSSSEDHSASQRRLIWSAAWFADPIFFGDYPEIMREYIGARLPQFTEQQKRDLNGSHDFFGLNHYTTKWVKAMPENMSDATLDWFGDQRNYDSACNQYNNTPIGIAAASDWLWTVPDGLYKILKWIDVRYGNPTIYVTENGCDVPGENGLSLQDALNDTFRIRFYDGYITAMTKAIHEGSNVKGYFAWSLMDNYEWADGYSKRFGLHYVNYTDLSRHAKQSAKWFSHYANVYNPNASYKAPTLSSIAMSAEYAESVCPSPQPTESGAKQVSWTVIIVLVVVAILIVLTFIVVAKYMCWLRSKLVNQTVDVKNMTAAQAYREASD